LLAIWIDAFDGTPEGNDVRDKLMSLVLCESWKQKIIDRCEKESFWRLWRKGHTIPAPRQDFYDFWIGSQIQIQAGEVKIRTLEQGGFQVEVLPKGGPLAELYVAHIEEYGNDSD